MVFKEKNVSLIKEDFTGLLATITRRQELIKSEPPLYAYWRTTELIQLPKGQANVPELIAEHTDYLLSHREVMDREDYVYVLSHLGSYCVVATNNQFPGYEKLSMDLAKCQIESKHAPGVKGIKTPLPRRLFFTLIRTALINDKEVNWAEIKMEGIEPAEGSRNLKDWTEAFIKAYRLKLNKNQRTSCIAHSRMWRDFYLEDYVEAARQIPLIDDSENNLTKLGTRRMELIIHDELIHSGCKLQAKAAQYWSVNGRRGVFFNLHCAS